jgi:CMP-N-acetylneuraminic acid synthetase
MEIVALLPMKGHSERVPNKNLKLFAGKPLYHAIVSTLIKCSSISKVIINTDSELIKKDALDTFGDFIIIHDRPKEICGDFVSMNEIIHYDILKHGGEHFIQTHSTNPVLKETTIQKAIEEYTANIPVYDSVFSVTKWQTRLYWQDGSPVNHNPTELLRTQDLPPVFEENSNFYIFSKNSFTGSGKKRIGEKPRMFEVNKIEAVDIDNPEDFIIAEQLYTMNER